MHTLLYYKDLKKKTHNTLSRGFPQVDVYRVQRGSCLVLFLPSLLSSFFWICRIYWWSRLFRVMIVFLRSGRFTRPGSRIYVPNIASNPSIKCDTVYTHLLAWDSSISSVRILIYLDIIKKEKSFLLVYVIRGQGTIRGDAYVYGVYAFVSTYARARKILAAERER